MRIVNIISARPVIVLLTSSAGTAQQITRMITDAGAEAQIVADADALWHAFESWPALAIIDLTAPDWEIPVRRAKNQPHTKAIPIVAISPDLDAGEAFRARAAGCAEAWRVADLAATLPGLLDAVLHPPTRWPAGWDASPPAALCRGIEQFNAGEYWECHETLEALWVAEPRPIRELYQGILQVGVAFHHMQQRNYAGAIKMFRRGLPRLIGLPEMCQGVHVAALAAAARAIHDAVVALGPTAIETFDLTTLPKVMITGCAGC